MPLYFAYGANMDVEDMARRCPRSQPLGVARLMRHRLAIMREGWLTATRDARGRVHGVLWDLALADVSALDRFEQLADGLYVKTTQAVIAAERAEAGAGLFRRERGAGERGRGLHPRGDRVGAALAAAGRGDRYAGRICGAGRGRRQRCRGGAARAAEVCDAVRSIAVVARLRLPPLTTATLAEIPGRLHEPDQGQRFSRREKAASPFRRRVPLIPPAAPSSRHGRATRSEWPARRGRTWRTSRASRRRRRS